MLERLALIDKKNYSENNILVLAQFRLPIIFPGSAPNNYQLWFNFNSSVGPIEVKHYNSAPLFQA